MGNSILDLSVLLWGLEVIVGVITGERFNASYPGGTGSGVNAVFIDRVAGETRESSTG